MSAGNETKLGELVLDVEQVNPDRLGVSAFSYIDISSVDQDSKRIIPKPPIPVDEAPSRARQLVAASDVLVSTVRPNLNAVAMVPASLDGAIASTGFCVLRPDRNKLDANFLFHWVKTRRFVSYLESRATGASYPAVTEKVVFASEITLPPLAEQKRIAAVLDKADALRAKRRQALATLDTLLQSVFLDMFGRSAKAPPIALRADLPATSEGWHWHTLTSVAKLATGHTPDRKRPDYWNGTIPWITLSNIRELDGCIAMDTDEHATAAGIRHSSAVLLPHGTVCFSRTASVGFVTMMGREMCTSQDFVNWVCGPKLIPEYLMWALIYSRESLRALSSGSTHKTIYFPTVERFCVMLPPVHLQQAFARVSSQIRIAKEQHTRAMELDDALFASLQSAAFAGTLFDGESAKHARRSVAV